MCACVRACVCACVCGWVGRLACVLRGDVNVLLMQTTAEIKMASAAIPFMAALQGPIALAEIHG